MPVEELARGEHNGGRWAVRYVYRGNGDVTHIRVVNTTGVPLAFRLIETDDDVLTANVWQRTAQSRASEDPVDEAIAGATKQSRPRIKQGGEIPGPVEAPPRIGFAIECRMPGP